MPQKYHIITYGCQMNESDSRRLAASLEKKGYQPASKENEADLLVVNMCSVRQTAVDRIFGLSQKLSKLKTQNSKLKTILTGCILKSDRKKLEDKFDEIWENKNVEESAPGNLIPISNGCNNSCAYCAVPLARGKLVCRDYKKILEDVEKAAAKDSKEIWLLGQNVNDYKFGDINFAKLLRMINDVPGNFQIKFMSPHPKDFTEELIDAMADCKKAAHYLNLPLQSGDNKILKKMGRPYTAGFYRKLVKKIREKIPDIFLSTDIIVGFPGETKRQFENTLKLFKKINFDMAYISKFSPRPGTLASKMEDDVFPQEKKRRWKILNSLLS